MKHGMFKFMVTGLIFVQALSAFSAKTPGSCESSAISLSPSTSTKSFKFQDEYDVYWKENLGRAVCYLKFTAKKGNSYTFKTENSPVEIWAYTYPKESTSDTVWPPYIGDVQTAKDGLNTLIHFRGEDWYDEDPESWTYYIVLEAPSEEYIGASFYCKLVNGIEEDNSALPGSLEKPGALAFSQDEKSVSASVLATSADAGTYTFTAANLYSGVKYFLTVDTNSADNVVSDLEVGVLEVNTLFAGVDFLPVDYADTNEAARCWSVMDSTAGTVKYRFIPPADGTYAFRVHGDLGAPFTLSYWTVPQRKVSEHEVKDASGKVLDGEEGFTDTSCTPKLRRYPIESEYEDMIIDKELYKFSLSANRRYAFWTEGGSLATNLVMELYDSSGRTVSRGVNVSAADNNAILTYVPTLAGTYYLGVCQSIEPPEPEDVKAGAQDPSFDITCTLKAKEITDDDRTLWDSFDDRDDQPKNATPVSFDPSVAVRSAEHTLGLTDWVDYFRVDARRGVSYTLTASLSESATKPGCRLFASVYTMNGSSLAKVVNPYHSGVGKKYLTDMDLSLGVSLPSDANTTYYIKVSPEGPGVDYGPYTLLSTCGAPGGAGILKVDVKGPATGAFMIADDPAPVPEYGDGAELILPNGNVRLKFKYAAGWTQPSMTNVTVTVPGEYTFKYNDTFDPRDDVRTAASTLAFSAVKTVTERSLWGLDREDWFQFYAAVGKCYVVKTAGQPGFDAPVVTVTAADGTIVGETRTHLKFIAKTSGMHYIRVSRDNGLETCYSLTSYMPAMKTPAQYTPAATYAAKDLLAGVETSAVPGYSDWENELEKGDKVFSPALYKLSLDARTRYVFRTVTAGTKPKMQAVLYDQSGNVIAENYGLSAEDNDVLIAYEPAFAGTYYVGIAKREDTEAVVTFRAKALAAEDALPGRLDAFDPADDVHQGAASVAFDPDQVSVVSADHRLSLTDWADYFRIDARRGVSYTVKAVESADFIAPADNVRLVADVMTLSGTVLTLLKTNNVAVGSAVDLFAGVTFPTNVNQTYYLKVYVQNGCGLDYGAYKLESACSAPGGAGILKVGLMGAPAGAFQIVGDPYPIPSYTDGSELILPNGKVQLKFMPSTGWNVPATTNVTVAVPGEYVFKYTDTSDPRDDVASGAVMLMPGTTGSPQSRTLFDNDPADNFRFTPNKTSIYKFRLEDVTGAAAFTVTNASEGVLVPATTGVSNLVFSSVSPAYLTVTHPGVPADAAYTLLSFTYTPSSAMPSTSAGTASLTFCDGEAYVKAKLTGGSKYMFGVPAGVKLEAVTDAAFGAVEYDRVDGYTGFDTAAATYDAFELYPRADAEYLFRVSSSTLKTAQFRHRKAGEKQISQHKAETLAPGAEATVVPGYVNEKGSSHRDGIVDECLYKTTLLANKAYLVETKGAVTNLVLYVYDQQGKVVAESRTTGYGGAYDVRALVRTKTQGVYYIGLAQDGLDEIGYADAPAELAVTLSVSEATQDDEAAALTVTPAWSARREAGFTSNRWTRTYTVAARKGVDYLFATSNLVDDCDLTLAVRAFKKNGNYETALAAAVWSGKAGEDGVYTLKANENAQYFVEVSVADGAGLDHPAFDLRYKASAADGLGILKVMTKGAEGTWTVNNESTPKYADGDAILVAGAVTVKFGAVTGFSTPAAQNVTVGAWASDADTLTVTGVYSDTSDPRDDVASGAVMLMPGTTGSPQSRTLFDNDPADNFRFTPNKTSIYKFRLEDVTGAAAFTVTNASEGVLVPATTGVSNLVFSSTSPAYLTVTHPGVPADAAYTLLSFTYTPSSAMPSTSPGTASLTFCDGEAYVKAKLTGGSKYMFGVPAGVKLEAVTDAAFGAVEYDRVDGYTGFDTAAATYDAFELYPRADAEYLFRVSSSTLKTAQFRHQKAGEKQISQHKAETLAPGAEATVFPRYVNEKGSSFRDGIVDECLFKTTLLANKAYLVETKGAATNLVLYVYDQQGKVVAESRTTGYKGAYDVRALVRTKMQGVYYVGLAQDGLDEIGYADAPAELAVTLSVSEVTQDDEAASLTVTPAWSARTEAGFTSNRWTRTYTVAARKGVDYLFATSNLVDDCDLTLAVRAFKKNGNYETALAAAVWSGKAGEDGVYTLKANENAQYFVEVSVADGAGLDYPAFDLRCKASAADGLGILKVVTKGAEGTWTVNNESMPKYANGDAILVAGAVTVKFGAVTGFSTPAAQNVTVGAWASDADTLTVTGVYSDTSDPRDDARTGATALNITAKTQTVERTMWETDVADWFSLRTTAGTYYNLSLSADPAANLPIVEVYAADGVSKIAEGTAVQFAATNSAMYYAKVTQALGEGCRYTLAYNSVAVGTVSLDNVAYSVQSTAGKLDIKVSRTSKEGKVRVVYSTLGASNEVGRAYGATAVPGVHYETVFGELLWEDGDMSMRTVTVPIISELNGRYVGDKTFYFEIRGVESLTPPYAGEWKPVIAKSPACVTIKDAARPVPGKVSLPAASLTVADGESLSVGVARTEGTDGRVCVRLTTAAGTAPAGTWPTSVDTNLTWESGDAGVKIVKLDIPGREEMLGDKTFRVSIAAVTTAGYERPTLGTSSATVTVRDRAVRETAAEWIKGMSFADPVRATEGAAGTWYFAADADEFRSVPLRSGAKAEITYTVKGVGVFSVEPSFKTGAGTLACVCDNKTADVSGGVLYLGGTAVSTHTVKFTFTSEQDGTVAAFALKDGGQPYSWTALEAAEDPIPSSPNGLVSIESADTPVRCSWTGAISGEKIRYRLLVGEDDALKSAFCDETTDERFHTVYGFEPGKTYRWRVDTVVVGDDGEVLLALTNSVWSFKTAESVPETVIDIGCCGLSAIIHRNGDTVELLQGSPVSLPVKLAGSTSGATATVVGGALPDGLALKDGEISGVPTKPGEFVASIQGKSGSTAGATMTLLFRVSDAGSAIGTFTGLVEDEAAASPVDRLGVLTFTVTSGGDISASLKRGASSVKFSGKGFDSYTPASEGEDGVALLTVCLESVAMIAGRPYTNELSVVVPSAPGEDMRALEIPARASLSINGRSVPDADLYRDSTRVPAVAEAFASFKGYYTVSLPVTGRVAGGPEGAGYLTVTVDAAGVVRIGGQRADGTALTASGVLAFDSDCRADTGAGFALDSAVVPVYAGSATTSFGGVLVLKKTDGVIAADASGVFLWNESDATKTYGGTSGFSVNLATVGGFYDSLMNLQTYYLDTRLSVDVSGFTDSLEAAYSDAWFPAGFDTMLWYPGIDGDESVLVSFTGSNATLPTKETVRKIVGGKTLVDVTASRNACDVKMNFTKATGVFSGTFGVWIGDDVAGAETVQKEISGLKYQGVLLPVKDSADKDWADYPGLGYINTALKIPGQSSRTWTGSWLFGLLGTDISEENAGKRQEEADVFER